MRLWCNVVLCVVYKKKSAILMCHEQVTKRHLEIQRKYLVFKSNYRLIAQISLLEACYQAFWAT